MTATFALGIDTTDATLRLGLSNFSDVERCQAWRLGRQLSVQLHASLADFIAPQTWTDLAWLAVAKGPGSYTGTRIGMVTATTLAQQLQIPVFALSTLAIHAWAQSQEGIQRTTARIAVAMPGPKGHVHGGIYHVSDHQCEALVRDRQWSQLEWEQQCHQHSLDHQLQTDADLFNSTDLSQALLALGHLQWQQGVCSPWQQAQPYYPELGDRR